MSLLGGISSALGGLFKDTPGGMSAADKLTLIGSALSDFSNGGEPNMTLQARQMISGNAEQRQKQAAMDQLTKILMGGDQPPIAPAPPAPPIMQGPGMDGSPVSPPRTATSAPLPVSQPSPLNINDPRMMPVALAAMRSGINLAPVLDVMKAQQPDVGFSPTGMGYNKHDAGMVGKFQPTLDKGQEPLFDARGNIVGVRNMDGSVQSAAEMAGAVSGAQESAKAALDLTPVPMPDGSTRLMPRLQAAQILSGQGGGVPGGFGTSQTPGGKVAQEGTARTAVDRAAAEPKNFSGLQDQARTTDLVIGKIDKALAQITPLTAGYGALLSGLPQSHALDLKTTLDTIAANVGFDKLQEMRNNSPTGGALGQVSERENTLLQSVMGSLNQKQSPEQLRTNLKAIRDQLAAVKAQREQLYNRTYGADGAQAQPQSHPSAAWTPEQARAELARRRAQRGQ